ncbi:hypothetical protein NMY22_g14737 [Coprinellus aureogranulatus]|nr:hypothetical protein NMY22_g14737 [Coprinellus aureogranulatus]
MTSRLTASGMNPHPASSRLLSAGMSTPISPSAFESEHAEVPKVMSLIPSNETKTGFREHIAPGAIHNSSDRRYAARANTPAEKSTQEDIYRWITQEHTHGQPKKIIWLSGSSDTGKSAVAGSIAEACAKDGLLAGSFFVPPSDSATGVLAKRCLVATLAYQIARVDGFERLSRSVMDAIQRDQTLFDSERLTDQMDQLILTPLRGIVGKGNTSSPRTRGVIVVDGLGQATTQLRREGNAAAALNTTQICSLLLRAANDMDFPFLILVTTQSEAEMRKFVSDHGERFKEFSLDPPEDTPALATNAHIFNITNVNNRGGSRGAMEALLDYFAGGALHNSAERCDAPKCHPETTADVQMNILSWITNEDQESDGEKLLWLAGPAGTGKTAIAASLADICEQRSLLAATFFFSASSGSPQRRTKSHFISTLAYQLIQHNAIHGLKEEVLAAINANPIVFGQRLLQQMQVLILNPLRRVRRSAPNTATWPTIIIVDGLDECKAMSTRERQMAEAIRATEDDQIEILSALLEATNDPCFPFRFIVASRPEPAIRNFIYNAQDEFTEVFLDSVYDPDADIRLYMQSQFDQIRRRFRLPANWVSEAVMARLVQQASGQFIYAATAIRTLERSGISPQDQLNSLMKLHEGDERHATPFAALDSLYRDIIFSSPDPALAVKWIRFMHSNCTELEQEQYAIALLESYPGESRHLLGPLSPVLNLSTDTPGRPEFHFYHKSFPDYLCNQQRSADLYVSVEEVHHLAEARHYQVLKNRGPQGDLTDSGCTMEEFLGWYCWTSHFHLDLSGQYNTADVDWWISTASQQLPSPDSLPPGHSHRDYFIPMYFRVHEQCTSWAPCKPACKVWRKGLVRHFKANSWAEPTKSEAGGRPTRSPGRFLGNAFRRGSLG